MPTAPDVLCFTWEAYNYMSEDETCNGVWEAWDNWCWETNDKKYEEVCQPVEDAYYELVQDDWDG